MEVANIGAGSVRIKGKLAAVVVDPEAAKGKQQGDVVILLQDAKASIHVEGSRLTISGPGEYEVGGVKITGIKSTDGVLYYISLDSMILLVGKASSLKGKESLRDADMVVLLCDGLVDQSTLASVTSGVAIFYGEKAQENATTLGKTPEPMNKYVVTKDKLPSEMEVILLQ